MSRKKPIAPLGADAQKLYDAIRAKGYAPHDLGDGDDLRDAAHEAHHALYCGLRKPWTRDNIHEALLRRAKRDASGLYRSTELFVQYELHARAVEWTVCERYGVEYDVEHWADTMWWETIKNMNIRLPDVEQIIGAIKIAKGMKRIERYVDDVITLATAKPAKRRRASRQSHAIEPK